MNTSTHSPGLTRRRFLQGTALTAGTLAVSGFPAILHAKDTELTMLSWFGHAEPEVVGAFEERFKVRVRAKYYTGGDQMLALMAQSPPGTYDVILADAEYVQQLHAADYIEALDPADYPFDDFWPEFQRFPGHWFDDRLHAVFLRFGFLGLSHHLDALSVTDARSYQALWSPALAGRVAHFDWHLPNLGTISLLNGNASPFDLSDPAWAEVQAVQMSLKPQVRAFLDYGGILSALKNREVGAVPGIGDWITGVLQRDGARVTTTIPEQGGLQWTESLSIGKGSRRQDLARQFIQYMLSPEGQVRTATLKAYPAMLPTRSGWARLNADDPAEAQRQHMVLNGPNALDEIRAGRIKLRQLPTGQSLETWNDFWSRYKSA